MWTLTLEQHPTHLMWTLTLEQHPTNLMWTLTLQQHSTHHMWSLTLEQHPTHHMWSLPLDQQTTHMWTLPLDNHPTHRVVCCPTMNLCTDSHWHSTRGLRYPSCPPCCSTPSTRARVSSWDAETALLLVSCHTGFILLSVKPRCL